VKRQNVNGTTVLRGGVPDLLKTAAGAGLLCDTLPAEVLATVAEPPAAPAVEVLEVAEPTAVKPSKSRYTRPNGEPFYARKVTFGDRQTTDVDIIRDGIRGVDGKKLNMFFVGAPGCGKTACIEAAIHDWDHCNGMVTMLCNGSTTAADFTGSYVPQADGTFQWKDGDLVRAMEGGMGLYVDEIGRVDSKELVVLYSVMDGRDTITIPENPARGMIKAAPGFFVIASTNPSAPGCVMDDALLSRFAPPIEYTTEFGIAVKHLGVPTEVAVLARDMTKAVRNGTAYWAPTMRDLLQWKTAEKIFGERAAWLGLVTAAPVEAQPEVRTAIESATGMKMTGTWVL
jgi:hypothetical protein